MDLKEAEAKYLGKLVRHMATGLVFRIREFIIEPRSKESALAISKNAALALFEHPTLLDIPLGQPCDAGIQELETHFEVVL